MQIEDYSYGRVRIDGKVFENDLVVYPDKIAADWYRKEEERVSPVDIRDVLDYQPAMLIVGQGDSPVMVLTPETRSVLGMLKIPFVERPTGEAVLIFNEYQQEGTKAVGLFHLGP